jgi:hypothetical protein
MWVKLFAEFDLSRTEDLYPAPSGIASTQSDFVNIGWRDGYGDSGCDSVLDPSLLTYRNNFNGGVYLTSVHAVDIIGERWRFYARQILDRSNIDAWSTILPFTDQIAFGLAMRELDIPTILLPSGKNGNPHFIGRKRLSAIHALARYNDNLYDVSGQHIFDQTSNPQPELSLITDIISYVNTLDICQAYLAERKRQCSWRLEAIQKADLALNIADGRDQTPK